MLVPNPYAKHDIFKLIFLSLLASLAIGLMFQSAHATPTTLTIDVNSPADVPDFNPGDSVCETGSGNHVCTLRAAIQEANAHFGADTILLQTGVTYLLSQIAQSGFITAGLIITDPLTIFGAGPDSTVIDGNGGTTHARVFYITGTVTISGVTIQHGFSPNIGGGIYNTGSLSLINTAVISNTANGLNDWGGGIYNAGPMTLTNSTIRGNQTGVHNAYGGGIYNQGPLLILGSTISANSTAGSPGEGGGLFSIGYTSTLIASTISGNSAPVGGGIYKGGYPLYIVNSTISGNSSNDDGGGIYASSGTTGLFNVTVAFNHANADNSGFNSGGGVANKSGSTLTFNNTIIAYNTSVIPTLPLPTLTDDDCAGTINSQGYSIVSYVVLGNCTVTGPYTQTAPLLGTLQNNGGSTWTHALLPGSPAIDAGNPGGCTDNLGAPLTADQRGFHRPAFGSVALRCDIGAFELQRMLFLPLILK